MNQVKIAIFSDSHGQLHHMIAAMEEERPDRVFFLGDNQRDGKLLAKLYPQVPVDILRGNCDPEPGADQLLVEAEGARFLLVHGHLQQAKSGTVQLAAAGREAGADMVCFGHTHQGTNLWDGVKPWLFNPGTAGGVRSRVGYGVVEVSHGRIQAWLR